MAKPAQQRLARMGAQGARSLDREWGWLSPPPRRRGKSKNPNDISLVVIQRKHRDRWDLRVRRSNPIILQMGTLSPREGKN